MKLKQSKHEKELGKTKKEIARNRKEKRHRDIEKIRKYRDKNWDKIEERSKGYIFRNKEVDQEAIRKIIEYRERLKKENRGRYHLLQGDQISYIYRTSSTISNEKWKEYWKEKIHLRCPYIKKNKKPPKEIIYPQPRDSLEKEFISESEDNKFRKDDSIEAIKKSMEENQKEEFNYSQNNTFNDADPTPKNLLATVPKLNCFILKRTGNKSRSGATNVMHAK
jgi:hypothetical protein